MVYFGRVLGSKIGKVGSRIDLRKKVDKKSRGSYETTQDGGGFPIQGLEGRPDKGWRDKGQGLRIDFDPMDTPLVAWGHGGEFSFTDADFIFVYLFL